MSSGLPLGASSVYTRSWTSARRGWSQLVYAVDTCTKARRRFMPRASSATSLVACAAKRRAWQHRRRGAHEGTWPRKQAAWLVSWSSVCPSTHLQVLREQVVDVLVERDAGGRVDHVVHLSRQPLLVRRRQPAARLQQVARHDHDLRAQVRAEHALLAVHVEQRARQQPVDTRLACAR